MASTVTILFAGGGPMDGQSHDFLKGKIPRVIETMPVGKIQAGDDAKVGRYELRYVWVGDGLSEEQFRRRT